MGTWTEVRGRVLAGELSKRSACGQYGLHAVGGHQIPATDFVSPESMGSRRIWSGEIHYVER